MKQIYVYNNKNVNEFLFTKQVQDSYVTLPPATEIQPPPKDEGYVWLFDQDLQQWNGQIVDYRGQIVYNKRDSLISKKVSFVGEIGDGYTLVAPPDFQNSYRFNGESGSWQQATVGGIGEESDPIYTADKSKYALKTELFSKSYNDLTDTPKTLQEMEITITSDDILYGDTVTTLTQKIESIVGNMNVSALDEKLGGFATTINGTTFPTGEAFGGVSEQETVSDLLLRIMTRFDGDEAANAIRHQEFETKHEEFETRLTTLENNSTPEMPTISVNGFIANEKGEINLELTTDDIKSNYGSGENLTTELGNIENNMWENVLQQLKNYVKTVDGLSVDENGNVDLTGCYVYTINNSLTPDENGNVNGVVTSVNELLPDENGNVNIQFHVVSTVNTIEPDEQGNVAITSSEIPFKSGEESCSTTEYVQNVESKIDTFTAHKVAVCGNNKKYMLSDIYKRNSSVFVQLPYFDNVKQVSVSKFGLEKLADYAAFNSFILSNDGSLFVAGSSESGILGTLEGGNWAREHWNYKHSIIDNKLEFKQVSLGGNIAGALDKNNKLYVWGSIYEYFEQLTPTPYFPDKTWKQIQVGGDYMGGIDENDDLYMWFENTGGQIGNGQSYGWVDEPYLVDSSKKWRKVILPFGEHSSVTRDFATTHAIDSNGYLYGWGANQEGQLGNGTVYQQQLVPLLIDNSHDFIDGSAGWRFVILIDSNGHLYGCGNNSYGQLGLGNTQNKTTFVLIDNTKKWKKVACGNNHTLLIDSNGHLYGCGRNNFGQLGLGDTNDRNVITLIDDSKVYTDISCSDECSMVVYEKQVSRDSMYTQKAIINKEEIPVGTIITSAIGGYKDVPGYLICNGAAVSRTTYKRLFEVIGTTYGAGNGSTTFNLPNLIDKFVMGGSTAGTVKEAGLPNITGGFTARVPSNHSNYAVGAFEGGNGTSTSNTTTAASYSGSGNTTWQDTYRYGFALNASKSSSIYGKSTTVQPPALTMKFYIKY